MNRNLLSIAAGVALVLAPQAWAAALSTEVVLHPGANSPDSPATFTGTNEATGSLSSSSGPSTYTATGTAIADYGVLKTYASLELSSYLPNSYTGEGCGGFGCYIADPVYVTAGFDDTLTIFGGSGTGYLFLTFTVDGTTTMDTDLGNGTTVQGALQVFGNNSLVLNTGYNGGSNTFVSDAIEFIYGTPFDLSVRSFAFSVVIDTQDATGGLPYSHSGIADFLHTVDLSSLAVSSTADGGSQVAFTANATSGTTYPLADVSDVPEPATWAMIALALPAVYLGRKRR